jgi:hypothetical protein
MASSNKKNSNCPEFNRMEKSPSDQEKTFRRPPWVESPIGNANGESIESLTKRMERQAKKLKEDHAKMIITIDQIQNRSTSVQEVIDKLRIQLD